MESEGKAPRIQVFKSPITQGQMLFCRECANGSKWIVLNGGSFVHFRHWRDAVRYAYWLVDNEKPV